MHSSPEIWIPTSQMHVTVEEGKVSIKETMTMEKRKVKKTAGFSEKSKDAVVDPEA